MSTIPQQYFMPQNDSIHIKVNGHLKPSVHVVSVGKNTIDKDKTIVINTN